MFPLLSVSVSVNVIPVRVTFPLFSTVIVYLITSPVSVIPFELASVTVAVLVASIAGAGDIAVSVASSVVFPSVSSPSSDVSDTLFV